MSLPQKKILGKLEGMRQLTNWIQTTSNWPGLWKYRRQRDLLPPVRLRNGIVLHHGRHDNPLALLDEVFVKRWYDLTASAPPGANMLDIGANIGAVSLYWAQRSPSLHIHCYEPNPSAFATLRFNVEQNGIHERVTTFPEAVGRIDGVLRLWVDIPSDLSTAYVEQSPVDGGKRIDVPMIDMEAAWRRLDRKDVWLLKIDTEGAEVDILEGAPIDCLRSVQNAIVEYHDNIYPGSLVRCQSALASAGFRYHVLHHPWNEGIIYAHR